MALSPLDQIREAAEADLETFIKLVSPKRLLGSIHQELCRWWGREDARASQLVLLPRGHQKSAMIAYRAAWYITKHPDTTILYVSATADLAEKQLYAIKNILDNPIYKRYWPSMLDPDEGKREKWSVAEICVDHPLRKTEGIRDSTVRAAGLSTNVTGSHADVLIYDDIVVPGNAYTEDGREKVTAMYSQLASVANPGALEWITGTRYHPRDIYDTLLSMRETVYDKYGEVVREEEVYEVFQRVVETDGEFLWPKQNRSDGKYFGFDENILARIKAKYVDKTQYYAQYYNQPNSAENAPIDSSKFQYYDKTHLKTIEGDWFFKDSKLNVFAAIDFAFSLGKKSDYTALVTIGVDSEYNYYVLDIDRFKTSRITEYFEHIKKAQYKWGFRKIRCEVTVAQQMIVQELKENYIKPQGLSLSVDEFRPNRGMGDKSERILSILQAKFDNLQVWFYKGGNCQILEEELVLAHPAHDDVADALANAIAISTAPKKMFSTRSSGNVIFNSRFGGCNY